MKAKPYVGITGFKTTEEVEQIAKIETEAGFSENSKHTIMFGVLCSNKRLDDAGIEGTQSPSFGNIKKVLEAVPQWGIPMVHYHTPNHECLEKEVNLLFSRNNLYADNACRAVQLNIDWPEINQIQSLLESYPNLEIVLQLPKQAIESLSTDEIAKKANHYDGLVKYALVDLSGGKGVLMDFNYSLRLMRALNKSMPNTTIGVAGGFDAKNVEEHVPRLLKEYREPFFIDIQGRIRTDDKKGIDMKKAEAYIKASAKVFLA